MRYPFGTLPCKIRDTFTLFREVLYEPHTPG